MDEKDLATQPQETGQDPRLPGEDAHPWGEKGAEAAAAEGPLAPHPQGPPLKSLKGDRAFQRLRRGRSGRGRYLVVRWLPAEELRVGLVVPRKVGKAVVRNKVKRRLREILRRLYLPRAHLLILVQPEAREAGYPELFQDLVRALKRSGLVQ